MKTKKFLIIIIVIVILVSQSVNVFAAYFDSDLVGTDPYHSVYAQAGEFWGDNIRVWASIHNYFTHVTYTSYDTGFEYAYAYTATMYGYYDHLADFSGWEIVD